MKQYTIPHQMKAAVWRGGGDLSVEKTAVPEAGCGELLVRVEACGLCPTDIKKIELQLVEPPVILGHEMAGRVVAAGEGNESFLGRRVAVYHHVPCKNCCICDLGLYSQCEGYKRTGTTAGFSPAGGGWAEYVRVLPWIVDGGGVVPLPEAMPVETAVLMEPLNTCLKCVKSLPASRGTLVVLGQGPVGLMLSALTVRAGWRVFAVEPVAARREMALQFGVEEVFAPSGVLPEQLSALCAGLGPDAVVAATENEDAINTALQSVRFGGTMVLFAHTRLHQSLTVDGGEIGKAEKRLIGSYSSSVDLNDEVVAMLRDEGIPWRRLLTHVFPLDEINNALARARTPENGSLKIAVRMDGRPGAGKGDS